jgi:hypothetical protein
VALHTVVGGVVVRTGEETRAVAMHTGRVMGAAAVLICAILLLVLGKPAFDPAHVPDWLESPRGRQLPVDEVPT